MMKRFTETTKWSDPWFMDLPVKYKSFWFYICDQCDCAGVWEPNMRLAIAQVGESLELVEILRVFTGRIVQLDDGKLWIKKFIEFQYGILSPDCKPHLSVLKRLDSLGLSKGYAKGIHTLQEKEKDKEKDKEGVKGKPKSQQEVEEFCESIGLKKTDGEAMWLEWQDHGFTKTKDWKAKIRKWKICGYHPSQKRQNSQNLSLTTMTKHNLPLPKGCSIRTRDGEVLDYTGRVMDVNQVRRAVENEKLSQVE